MIPSVHLSYLPSFQLDVKYQSMSRHCSRFVVIESMSRMLPSHYLITSTYLPTHTEMSLLCYSCLLAAPTSISNPLHLEFHLQLFHL